MIMLFNYREDYKELFQTWINIYSIFEKARIVTGRKSREIYDASHEFTVGQIIGEDIGKIIEGKRKEILSKPKFEVMEFDNITEFADYVANIYEHARLDIQKDERNTSPKGTKNILKAMNEQFYSADGNVNKILKIYFPEQFGERDFLDYPIGKFFVSIANMWDAEKNTMCIEDLSDIQECLGSGVISEEFPGELVAIFNGAKVLFDNCTTIREIMDRIKAIIKDKKYFDSDREKEVYGRISYYTLDKRELKKLKAGLQQLNDIAEFFFRDFESNPNNFKQFYQRLNRYIRDNLLEREVLSEDFKDILKRVQQRLDEVRDIDASSSFECLKATMSVYLKQTYKQGSGAQWIVREFEQIDGDILRSRLSQYRKTYHFACLSNEDILSVYNDNFPWPLTEEFFTLAQSPVDWKYQVYVTSSNEYKNFKRYALVYGLLYNCGDYKLSYVKHDGEHEKTLYYLLEMLGAKVIKYKHYRAEVELSDITDIDIEGQAQIPDTLNDKLKYEICPYRYLLESQIEKKTIYGDSFLISKYLENVLTNKIYEKYKDLCKSEQLIYPKICTEMEEIKNKFPFLSTVQILDISKTVMRKLQYRSKATKIDDAMHMEWKVSEEFLYDKVKVALSNVLRGNGTFSYKKIDMNIYDKKVHRECTCCPHKNICLELYR